MSELITSTNLWQRSFGNQPEAAALAAALLKARQNVGDLLIGIPGDMKGYTVHDLSHLDALWEIADLITGPGFSMNPAEAFVFGMAVLLHDSAMSVMAYPGGIAEITTLTEWAEQASAYGFYGVDFHSIPGTARAGILTAVLRNLHAVQAEKLATQAWVLNGSQYHLIEDDELRAHYGPTAGKVAHSHHWDAGSLEKRFKSPLGSYGKMPVTWTVDSLKVAILLRCADAAHIDHRRAPRRLFAMTKPLGLSEKHWNFQSKLAKPYLKGEKILYSSTDGFDLDCVDAWYLCYDTARMVDRELGDAEELLQLCGTEFAAKGVFGIKSVSQFAETVHTQGWKPVSVDVQVSDVPGLARTLGGEALYTRGLAPIRELIQNAADAVEARSQVDPSFSKEDGSILVRLTRVDNGHWRLDVEDNGLGMSERILTRALLDFGKSFWRSELVQDEYPEMKGGFVHSRGRFGIGFFSVFMWTEKVTVVSRKFRGGTSETMALEFLGGISHRPILREAHPREQSTSTTTRVSLIVTSEIADILLGKKELEDQEGQEYKEYMPWESSRRRSRTPKPIHLITAALEIDVFLEAEGSKALVNNRQWASLEPEDFIHYFNSICGEIDLPADAAPLLSEVIDSGRVVGKALIVPPYLTKEYVSILIHEKGIVIRVESGHRIFGVIEGAALNAARDRAKFPNPAKDPQWIETQKARIFLSAPDIPRQISAQSALIEFDKFSVNHTLFILDRQMLSLTQVLDKVATFGRVELKLGFDYQERIKWEEVKELKAVVGLDVNSHRLFVLTDLPLEISDDSEIEAMFAGSQQNTVVGEIFSELGRVLGPSRKFTLKTVEHEYSRKHDIVIILEGA